jgi:hypothetical protein
MNKSINGIPLKGMKKPQNLDMPAGQRHYEGKKPYHSGVSTGRRSATMTPYPTIPCLAYGSGWMRIDNVGKF